MTFGERIKKTLFRECYGERLGYWECPSFLFFIMGLFTIAVMTGTYILSSQYGSPEIVIISLVIVTAVLVTVGYLVTQTVSRIGMAKRLAEYERKKSESIIANLTDGLVMLSREKNVIMVNPKAEEYLGVSEEEILGKKVDDKELLVKYPRLKYFFSWFPRSSKDLTKVEKEEVEIANDNKEFFDIYTTSVLDRQGKALGIVKTFHDITRDKLIDQMKTEFISIASHQLRTPLAGFKWFIELMLRERVGEITAQQRELLEKMEENNESLIDLIEHLLNISRIEQGRMDFKFRRGNFATLIKKEIDILEPKAQAKDIKIEFIKEGKEVPEFKYDEEKISFALQNLIDNAIKYTKPGGRVIIKEELKAPDQVQVAVTDTGIGIDDGSKKRVFTKFFRSSAARVLAPQGTGLGLNIAKNIIDKHKGKIWFDTNIGKGTTFYFTLPLRK